jgi:BlaI family transcriptional regulator, penicillinase repressor
VIGFLRRGSSSGAAAWRGKSAKRWRPIMSLRLGRVQMRIMRVLWAQGRASAREITDTLNRDEPITHSTVQTLLRGLEAKKAVAHDTEGRTFVFYPLVREEQAARSATRDLLDRLFDGRASKLVSHLLENEKVSADELKAIRRLIDKQSRQ